MEPPKVKPPNYSLAMSLQEYCLSVVFDPLNLSLLIFV